jgi:enterochelin esterase-like enzyme
MRITSSDLTLCRRTGCQRARSRDRSRCQVKRIPVHNTRTGYTFPHNYDAAKPASLMIFNDGQAYMAPEGDVRAQNVMDNLIYRREIPVMIGVFINPGRRPDQPEPHPKNWGDRDTNRPTEYNTLDDKYARVIVDELLPVLYKEYNISKDPEQHGIGGASSGGIAAFTVACNAPIISEKYSASWAPM